ncbi:MAG TPA: DUF6518 family protein, partial [Thermomicrobiales bacterium]|nr:DUF6518 family protein [Thermomicrobiales bacterium]
IVLGLSLDSYNDPIAWAIGGVTAGPLLAASGYLWRNGSDRWRIVSTALLAATFVSEGIYIVNTLGYEIGYAFIGVGATFAVAMAGAWRNLAFAMVLAALLSVALWAAYRYGYTRAHDAIAR